MGACVCGKIPKQTLNNQLMKDDCISTKAFAETALKLQFPLIVENTILDFLPVCQCCQKRFRFSLHNTLCDICFVETNPLIRQNLLEHTFIWNRFNLCKLERFDELEQLVQKNLLKGSDACYLVEKALEVGYFHIRADRACKRVAVPGMRIRCVNLALVHLFLYYEVYSMLRYKMWLYVRGDLRSVTKDQIEIYEIHIDRITTHQGLKPIYSYPEWVASIRKKTIAIRCQLEKAGLQGGIQSDV